MIGYVEAINTCEIAGWALDPSTGDSPLVSIIINGVNYLDFIPKLPRADLIGIVSPHGVLGFRVPIAPYALVKGDNDIRILFADTQTPLVNGVNTVRFWADERIKAGLALSIVKRGQWVIDWGEYDGAVLKFTGWGIIPPGARSFSVTANGRPLDIDIQEYDDIRRHYRLPEGVQSKKFSAEYRFPESDPSVTLAFGDGHNAFDPSQNYYLPKTFKVQPPPGQMVRVAGTDSSFKFECEGFGLYIKFKSIYERFSNKKLAAANTLDWGCGCGRHCRYFTDTNKSLTGVDIDKENVQWCSDNLKGTFLHSRLEPPLPFNDNSFDFIYAVSVLTHLSKKHEAMWLEELRRIAMPGAILVLTTIGGSALFQMGRSDEYAAAQINGGFIDLGKNDDLKGYVEDGYYINAAHSLGYIHEEWGKVFEILHIEENCIGNLQDAVVLRKSPDSRGESDMSTNRSS